MMLKNSTVASLLAIACGLSYYEVAGSIHGSSGTSPGCVKSKLSSTRVVSINHNDDPRGGAAVSITKTKRKLGSIELAMAGAVATMIGDASMHPIDCIKTLQQSNEGIGLNMATAAKQIFQNNGIGGFFNGIGIYVISDGMAGAIKFATYEALKSWVDDKVPEKYQGAAIFGIAAMAFLASSVVLVPGELIKQRLQMGQITSVSQGVASIWKNEGLLGFYQGYSGVCLRDIPYTMLELGIYQNLKTVYLKLKNKNNKNNQSISQIDEIIAAAIAGCITGFVTNPLDTIKTKLMVDAHLYKGFADCFQKTVNQHGASSLLQGAAARVSWIGPFTAIYLPIYEVIKRRMETSTTIFPSFLMPAAAVATTPTPQPTTTSTAVLASIKVTGGAQQVKVNMRKSKTLRLERNDCFVSF